MINLENIVCERVPMLASFRESGKTVAGPSPMYVVKEFSHGLQIADLRSTPEVKTLCNTASVASPPASRSLG